MSVIVLGALALPAIVPATASAPGRPHGGRDNRTTIRPAPLERLNGHRERAGALQHAPTNLGGLTKPKPRQGPSTTARKASQGAETLPTARAARGFTTLAISAKPPNPTITAAPPNPTTVTSASFSFTDADATATFECRLDGAAFAACTSPKTYAGPLSYAKHTFHVRARNSSGTSGDVKYEWTINRPPAPPAPTITAAPTSPTTATSASFSFTDADATATFECRLDGATFAVCTSPTVYGGPLAVGSHTFSVRARTSTGNAGLSPNTNFTWTITLVAAPGATTITSAPADPTTATSASFSFTNGSAGATFECQLDGLAFAACTSPKSYAGPLALGGHTFGVRARTAGGVGPTAIYAWTINAIPPPPAPSITSGPTNPTTATGATFTFSDSEAGVTFECKLDTAAFATCASPTSYSGLTLGTHTFQVQARNAVGTSSPTIATWTVVQAVRPLKTRLLVIAADGQETDFPALKAFLDQIGVPYSTLIATQTALTPDMLSDGTTGRYQGVILTTGNLTYLNSGTGNWESAFTAAEWQTLWDYEAAYKVRQVTSFTFPYGAPDDYGLDLVTHQDTLTTPLQANLTAAGRSVFPYLNASNPVTFTGAWVYLATQRDSSVTPLITTSNGYVIASTDSYADGRENLAVTAANNPFLLHSQLLAYGLVNWVTRGVFLGERHVNLDVEIDDLLIDSDMWDVNANNDLSGLSFRMSATDFDGAIAWQNGQRGRSPQLSQLKLEWAFNGEGAFGDPPDFTDTSGAASIYPNDTLTPDVVQKQGNFNYINHTYTHQNVDRTNYASSLTEIQNNQQAAAALGLTAYTNQAFVQPDISGLTNNNFLQAAWDAGVRYLITDTSVAAWNNPSPNTGFYVGGAGKQLLAIPRHPSNLFYNLRTPDEWVDEYNWYYWKGSPSNSQWKFWDDPQTYSQIIDHESDQLLSYLLRWDVDPLMFHQANLGLYDGQHSLLGDVLTATFNKYLAVYNLPIRNLRQDEVGQVMAGRMAYNRSGVDGTLVPCQSLTLSVANAASIPVTGVSAGTTETYGGQSIGNVAAAPGSSATIPVRC
jgi:hypothetical protein